MTIRRTRTIGLRNRQIRQKKVSFVPSTTQRVAKRIIRKYKNQGKRRKAQTGGSILRNLEIIDEGIKHALDLYKYGTFKIRNKKVQKALYSDIANYIVTKTQNNLNNFFGGV